MCVSSTPSPRGPHAVALHPDGSNIFPGAGNQHKMPCTEQRRKPSRIFPMLHPGPFLARPRTLRRRGRVARV
ncbi:hypothetical protein M430DRAFT_199165 [Amorphotheca resinae ATCC 22711]|uniref:Uncharacterized protein n=1 Tax=Amorphotheca resinae ATCC 22711 TaxID=857342 RepID=A0A2T3BA77_AMORE|nr:hypothetical protein M430DRAFT_199165 [Amorphotheca resinae ATCC 22711]PSS25174.1 hypothetical protein M430DRAFT_199165 [Amorphotheca resinae ATCC 22711]